MIGTELSAYYNVAHGASLSVIIPSWMKYVYKEDVARFARFATEVFDVKYDKDNLELTALKGIDAITEFFKAMNMPTTMKELEILDDSKFEAMATQATRFGNIGCIKSLDKNDVINILNMA